MYDIKDYKLFMLSNPLLINIHKSICTRCFKLIKQTQRNCCFSPGIFLTYLSSNPKKKASMKFQDNISLLQDKYSKWE